MNLRVIFIFLTFGLFLSTTRFVAAQDLHLNLHNGVMMAKGYDVVAYFDQKVLEGKDTYRFVYEGVVYRFSSENNLKRFKENPSRFVPQYGGWCAYAMGSHGYKVQTSASNYLIYKGKLYFFKWSAIKDFKDKWLEDVNDLISSGDANWNKILNQ